MLKSTASAIILFAALALGISAPAKAGDIISTIGSYDSPDGYDYDTTYPPTTYQNIGTFTFTIPPGEIAAGVTVSGSFGNGDSPTTALSDYYLGFAGDEEAVTIETCDSALADCSSNQNGPTDWSVTLTQAEIEELAPALTAGSVDFGYTWDASPPAEPIFDFFTGGYDPQFVYAGAATLDVTPTPEPGTVLFCLSGLASLAAFRRFRKL